MVSARVRSQSAEICPPPPQSQLNAEPNESNMSWHQYQGLGIVFLLFPCILDFHSEGQEWGVGSVVIRFRAFGGARNPSMTDPTPHFSALCFMQLKSTWPNPQSTTNNNHIE